jgi:hypothetical protein
MSYDKKQIHLFFISRLLWLREQILAEEADAINRNVNTKAFARLMC